MSLLTTYAWPILGAGWLVAAIFGGAQTWRLHSLEAATSAIVAECSEREASWDRQASLASEANRKLKERAVKVDGEVVEDGQQVLQPGFEGLLQVGKRTFARVRLVFASRAEALMVPEEALVPQGGKQFVIKLVEEEGIKMGALAQPVRVALTGRTASPGLFEVMEVLGRDRTLLRLRNGIERASNG